MAGEPESSGGATDLETGAGVVCEARGPRTGLCP